jgi:mortality factor 4-like protein 1
MAKPAVRIVMPDALKSILVDDWENITKNYQLVRLPALYSVNRILDDYQNQERPRRQDSISLDLLEEVVAGLKEYFNKSLGRILLYKYERGQYEDLLGRIDTSTDDLSGRQLADVYGAEHLLRLFGNMEYSSSLSLANIL